MKTFFQLILEGGRASTIHALSYIAGSKSRPRRYFWLLVAVLCTLVVAIWLSNLTAKFFSYEKTTNLIMKYEETAFPAVTICSLNPYKNSEALKNEELAKLITTYRKAVNDPGPATISQGKKTVIRPPQDPQSTGLDSPKNSFPPLVDKTIRDREKRGVSIEMVTICACDQDKCIRNFREQEGIRESIKTKSIKPCVCRQLMDTTWECQQCLSPESCTFIEPIQTTTTEAPTMFDAYGFEEGSDEIATQAKAQENLPFISANLSSEDKDKLSISVDELIKNCAFNAESCDTHRDFEQFDTSKFGRCFTFNRRNPAKFISSRPGPLYGLRLLLFSNVSEYMATTETAGVRIVIHEQDSFPFPDTFGFNTPVGTATAYSLKAQQNSRMAAPYGDCMELKRPPGYLYEGKYTVEGCRRSCYQSQALSACGCCDPRLPLLPGGHHFCSLNDLPSKECLLGLKADDSLCECPVSCEDTTFSVTISSSKWPIGNQRVASCLKQNKSSSCEDNGQNSLLVEIYFEALGSQIIWETPSYSFASLVSDMAGLAGFWLGVSFMGFIEFGFFLFHAFVVTAAKFGKNVCGASSIDIEEEEDKKEYIEPDEIPRTNSIDTGVGSSPPVRRKKKNSLELARDECMSKIPSEKKTSFHASPKRKQSHKSDTSASSVHPWFHLHRNELQVTRSSSRSTPSTVQTQDSLSTTVDVQSDWDEDERPWGETPSYSGSVTRKPAWKP